MKLLLDENLPVRLKADIPFGEVFIMDELGWRGKQNGELLGLLESNGFQFLITMDKSMRYQQSVHRFDVRLIVLRAVHNKRSELLPLIPSLETYLRGGEYEKVKVIATTPDPSTSGL